MKKGDFLGRKDEILYFEAIFTMFCVEILLKQEKTNTKAGF